ncbi:MAG: UV DNA damage repair endonuclease UvsE, partial [Cellulosilyticaceae bacterium]
EKIREVIEHNIILLGDIIYHNIKDNIYVYRITAELIPFIDNQDMKNIFKEYHILESNKIKGELERIKKWQQEYNLRISMHTSHFTMLASPKEKIIEKSIGELRAQAEFLHQLGGENLVIHIGGAYGNKTETLERFKQTIKNNKDQLDLDLLTVENDDKTYTSKEIVEVCKTLNLKWVYDFHHERCNPSEDTNIVDLLRLHPPSKCHLSSGAIAPNKPQHADFIEKEDIKSLQQQLTLAGINQVDIVFEAKQKDLSIYEIMKPLKNGFWKIKSTQ